MSFIFNNGPMKRQITYHSTRGVVAPKEANFLQQQLFPVFTSRDTRKISMDMAHYGDSEAMEKSKQ